LFIVARSIILKTRNVSDKSYKENQNTRYKRDKIRITLKTHVVCPNTFFSAYPAVYEIMWKNAVEKDGPQTTT